MKRELGLLNLICVLVALGFLALAVYGIVLPTLRPLFPAVSLARVLRETDCNSPISASAGFHEPSLVFLTSSRTRLTDGSGSADFLKGGPCRFALVEFREQRSFAQRADAIGLRYSRIGLVDGYNHSQGREISVAIFRSEGSL